jgi:hypothetical protein
VPAILRAVGGMREALHDTVMIPMIMTLP